MPIQDSTDAPVGASRLGPKPVVWTLRCLDKIEFPADPGRCWRWKNGLNRPDGYPQIRLRDKAYLVHVLSWEFEHGPIPEGFELHHKCLTKACVNPKHLRLVTPKQHRAIHRALREAA
jgi:hypothetical protein